MKMSPAGNSHVISDCRSQKSSFAAKSTGTIVPVPSSSIVNTPKAVSYNEPHAEICKLVGSANDREYTTSAAAPVLPTQPEYSHNKPAFIASSYGP